MLRDVSRVDMRTSILGQEVSFPVCVGATAMQKMAHGDGELATVRGWFTHYTHTSGDTWGLTCMSNLSFRQVRYLYDVKHVVYH